MHVISSRAEQTPDRSRIKIFVVSNLVVCLICLFNLARSDHKVFMVRRHKKNQTEKNYNEKKLQQNSERLAFLGIMGIKLRAP